MKYGRMRGETRDVTEEEKVTEQEEIWTGCVKWPTFLTAAVTAVVQVWFRLCVCMDTDLCLLPWNSERIRWECGAVHVHSYLGAYCTHRGTLKPAGNPHVSVLSSWILPAEIFLQPVHGWSSPMDTSLWVCSW